MVVVNDVDATLADVAIALFDRRRVVIDDGRRSRMMREMMMLFSRRRRVVAVIQRFDALEAGSGNSGDALSASSTAAEKRREVLQFGLGTATAAVIGGRSTAVYVRRGCWPIVGGSVGTLELHVT